MALFASRTSWRFARRLISQVIDDPWDAAALADPPALTPLIAHDFGAATIIVFTLGSFSINLHVGITVCQHGSCLHILEVAVAWRAL